MRLLLLMLQLLKQVWAYTVSKVPFLNPAFRRVFAAFLDNPRNLVRFVTDDTSQKVYTEPLLHLGASLVLFGILGWFVDKYFPHMSLKTADYVPTGMSPALFKLIKETRKGGDATGWYLGFLGCSWLASTLIAYGLISVKDKPLAYLGNFSSYLLSVCFALTSVGQTICIILARIFSLSPALQDKSSLWLFALTFYGMYSLYYGWFTKDEKGRLLLRPLEKATPLKFVFFACVGLLALLLIATFLFLVLITNAGLSPDILEYPPRPNQ